MKKLILLGVAVCAFWACDSAVEGYKVNVMVDGDMTQLKSDTIIMANTSRENPIADTAVLVKGGVTFSGMIDTPQYMMIAVKNGEKKERLCVFFLENGMTDINIKLAENERPDVEIKGGAFQTVSDSLNAIRNDLFEKVNMDSLMKVYRTADDKVKERIAALYDSLSSQHKRAEDDYLMKNPTSLYAFQNFVDHVGDMPLEKSKALLEEFKALPQYAGNKNIQKVEQIIAILNSLQPGMVAPDFVQNDPEGNPVTFSDVYKKNKVTMVDFWASWCGPCRAFNPTLVKIFKEYNKKGFGIIGVSLDRNHDAWVKGIKDDGLTWPQVSDLGFWDNVVAKQYYVRFVPQNIFVDQEGKIIKRHASEDEIVELLKENL